MKNLKDILEKLSIDDIVDIKEFPIDGTIEEIVDFLKKEGFKEVEYEIRSIYEWHDTFWKTRTKCFSFDEEDVYFVDAHHVISRDNYILKISDAYRKVYTAISDRERIEISKGQFKDLLKEYFGWE